MEKVHRYSGCLLRNITWSGILIKGVIKQLNKANSMRRGKRFQIRAIQTVFKSNYLNYYSFCNNQIFIIRRMPCNHINNLNIVIL